MTTTTDRIAEARKILEAKWDAEGECRSCGWHASLFEHDVEDEDIEWALEHDNGILDLPCVSNNYEDSDTHRGVQINILPERNT